MNLTDEEIKAGYTAGGLVSMRDYELQAQRITELEVENARLRGELEQERTFIQGLCAYQDPPRSFDEVKDMLTGRFRALRYLNDVARDRLLLALERAGAAETRLAAAEAELAQKDAALKSAYLLSVRSSKTATISMALRLDGIEDVLAAALTDAPAKEGAE